MKISITSRNLLTLTALSLALSACGGTTSPDASQQANSGTTIVSSGAAQRPDRIPLVVGGSVVAASNYPWMTALVNADDQDASTAQFCGGSLIAPDWVLTAAHCLEDMQAADTDVLLGQSDLNQNNGERIGVDRIIMHPDYASQGFPDLALLQLSGSSSAPVISLPSRNNPAPNDGELATVTGWGQISETGPASTQLRETTMPVVDHNTCNQAYDDDIDQDSMVCAGSPSGDRDSCYGDSGGPLFVQRNAEFVQAGVVSFGEACGLAGVPGVYARVASYYDWISGYAPVKAYSPGVGSGSANGTAGSNGENTDNNSTNAGAGSEVTEENEVTENTDMPDYTEFSWQFSGQVNGWYEEAFLPADEGAIEISAGVLTLDLQTQSEEPLILFVDEYDAEFDEWYSVTGAISRDGSLVLDIDIDDGFYAFSVVALGQGGSFTLNANVSQ